MIRRGTADLGHIWDIDDSKKRDKKRDRWDRCDFHKVAAFFGRTVRRWPSCDVALDVASRTTRPRPIEENGR